MFAQIFNLKILYSTGFKIYVNYKLDMISTNYRINYVYQSRSKQDSIGVNQAYYSAILSVKLLPKLASE